MKTSQRRQAPGCDGRLRAAGAPAWAAAMSAQSKAAGEWVVGVARKALSASGVHARPSHECADRNTNRQLFDRRSSSGPHVKHCNLVMPVGNPPSNLKIAGVGEQRRNDLCRCSACANIVIVQLLHRRVQLAQAYGSARSGAPPANKRLRVQGQLGGVGWAAGQNHCTCLVLQAFWVHRLLCCIMRWLPKLCSGHPRQTGRMRWRL